MGFGEMAVAIVLIVTIGRIVRERFRSQRRLPGKSEITAEQDNIRLQSEVARLNDRLRVLERLATDPARRLADEIDSLKDK